MKTSLPLAVLILFLMASCGVHIQKRVYRDGFYIDIAHNKSHQQSQAIIEQQPVSATYNEVVQEETDTVLQSVPEKCSAHPLTELLPSTEEKTITGLQTASPETAVPTDAPGNEMAKIEKLNKNGTAWMKASLIVFPLAFLTLLIALVLSLIALAKIHKLKRAGNLSTEQESNLAQQKKRARKTAWISGVIVALLIAAFFLTFFFTGPFGFTGNIPPM